MENKQFIITTSSKL